MITLYNQSVLPRDGFSYYHLDPNNPQAAFTIPVGTSLEPAITQLLNYRRANAWLGLPTDYESCRQEILTYTYARLKLTLGLPYTLQFFSATNVDDPEILAMEQEVQKKTPAEQLPTSAVGAAVADARDGIAALRDWLGDSARVVGQAKAEQRARVCKGCPLNQKGNWMERLAASVVGAIHRHIEQKKKLNLSVPNEDKLNTCAACHCFLPTKVWVPIEYITEHMREATRAKLDPRCWILKESEPPKKKAKTPAPKPRKLPFFKARPTKAKKWRAKI